MASVLVFGEGDLTTYSASVKQFMGGLGFILATWVVQIMTLMRDFYAATAMALSRI